MNLLAFHITFGTYGTRLHGDPRGTVDRQHNLYGEPVLEFDEHRWEREKSLLKFPPVIFTRDQMILVESLLSQICDRGGWTHRTCAAGPDHVHEILTSRNDPKTIRRLLKRWLSQELTNRLRETDCPQSDSSRTGDSPALSRGTAPWFAESGSIRWIFEEDGDYYQNAINYVTRQRATRDIPTKTR